MDRYIIGSLWDRANRNGANKNFEYLFEGRNKIDELNHRAEIILTEAKETNDMNKDVQEQINRLIISDGESDAEVIQARGNAPLLKDRLDKTDSQLAQIAVQVPSPTGSDDTANIQTAIDYLKEVGGNELFFQKGVYLSNGLLFSQMNDFKISGYGATVKRNSILPDNQNNLIEFLNCKNVNVEGLTVHGDNEKHGALEKQLHNISLYGCENITLTNAKSMYSICDGVYVNRASGTRHGITFEHPQDSKNIILQNVFSTYSARQGMSVISVDGLMAMGCEFNFTGRSSAGSISPVAGVDLESNAMTPWQPKRVTFDNCIFNDNNGGGLIITSSNDFTIVRNSKMQRNLSFGLESSGRNVIIENVDFDSNGGSGNARPEIQVSNSRRDGDLSSISLKNIVIRNAVYGGINIHEGVRFIGENIEIIDSNNYGIRLHEGSGTDVYDWTLVKIINSTIRRIYRTGIVTAPAYLSLIGVFKSPVTIDGLVIDKSDLDISKDPMERGVDLPINTVLLKDLKIIGDFTDFSARNVRGRAKKTENNTLNGLYEQTLNYTEGATSNRPDRPIKGRVYFDTSLNKPIFCKTEAVQDENLTIISPSVWVDATGIVV